MLPPKGDGYFVRLALLLGCGFMDGFCRRLITLRCCWDLTAGNGYHAEEIAFCIRIVEQFPCEAMHGSRTLDAFAKFDVLERRADFAEGRCDALGFTSLEDGIDQLKASEAVDAELEAMKAALKARAN